MANLSKQQVADIIKNAPQGSNPKDILKGLVQRGYALEGYTPPVATPTKQSFTSGASGTWEAPKTPKEMLTAEDFKREMLPPPTVPITERLKTSATSGLDTAKEAFAVGSRGAEQALSTFDTDKTGIQKTGDVLMGTGKVIGGTLGTVIGSGISSIFGFIQPEFEKVVNAGAETAKSIAKQGALSQGLSELQAEQIAQETFNENVQKVLTKAQKAKDDFVKFVGDEQQANDLLKSGEYILDSIGLEVVKAPISRISKEVTRELPKVAETVKSTAVKLGEDVAQAGKVIGEDLAKVPNKIGESLEQTAKEVYREQARDIAIPKLDELKTKERAKVAITPTRNREIALDPFKEEQIDEVARMLEEGKLKSSDKVIQRGEIGKEIGTLAEELRYNLSSYNNTLKFKDEILAEASDMAYKLADDTAISIISGGNPEKFVNDFLEETKRIMDKIAPNVDGINPSQLLTVRQKIDDFVEKLKGTNNYDKKKTVGQDLETAFGKANKAFRDFVNNQVKQLAPDAETSELLRRQSALYRVQDNLSTQISKEPSQYLSRKIKEIRDYIGVSPYDFWTIMGSSSLAGVAAGGALGLGAGLILPAIGGTYLAKNAIGKVIRVNDTRAFLGRALKNINKRIEKAPVSKRAELNMAKKEVENLLNLPKKVLDKAKVSFKIQNEKEAREVMKLIKEQELAKTKKEKATKKLLESSKTKPASNAVIPLERPRGQGVIELGETKKAEAPKKKVKVNLEEIVKKYPELSREEIKDLLLLKKQKAIMDKLSKDSKFTELAKDIADKIKKAEAPKKKVKGLTSDEQSDKYLYHGTDQYSFKKIKTEGIKPQRRGVSSFSKTEEYSKNWAFPATGTKGVMLRVKKDVLRGKTVYSKKKRPDTDKLYEILTKETVPPEALEVFENGKWKPLIGTSSPKKKVLQKIEKKDKIESMKNKYDKSEVESVKKAKAKGQSFEEWKKEQMAKTGVEVKDKTGIKLQDPYTAEYLPINSDGTITVYHSTTKEAAEKIKQSGLIGSRTEGGYIYFTTNKKGYGGIGKGKDTVLAFNINPKKIQFDDVYRGELHLKGNNADIGGIKPIDVKTSSELKKLWDSVPITKTVKVPKQLVEDIKKAKAKGQSFEEWVRGQGEKLYHGTADKFEIFDPKFKGYSTGAESAKGAFWFTDDKETAKAYAIYAAEDAPVQRLLKKADEAEKIAQRSGKESDWAKYDKLIQESENLAKYDATFKRRQELANVKEAYVKGDFLEIDAKGKTPQELSTDDNIDSWLNSKIQQAIKEKKAGLKIVNIDDAVGLYNKPSTHYAVFNPEQIKTSSELKKLWDSVPSTTD